MTGPLNLPEDKFYESNNDYGLNLNNSDIIGVNNIYFQNSSDNTKGIQFYRDADHYDSLFSRGGRLLYSPYREKGNNIGSSYEVITLGNHSRMPLLEKFDTARTNPISGDQWLRIGESLNYTYVGVSFILMLNRAFNNASNESWTFSVNCVYNFNANIQKLSGIYANKYIDKIRLVENPDTHRVFIDIHYNATNPNSIGITFIGGAVTYGTPVINPIVTGNVIEYNIE